MKLANWPDGRTQGSRATQSLDVRPFGQFANFIIHRTAAHLSTDIEEKGQRRLQTLPR
jgi:hypothetical protein